VLITSPMVGEAKLAEVAKLLDLDRDLMLVVDSLEGARSLEAKLKGSRQTARVLIDVDVGMHRTGVPDVRRALALAQHLSHSDRLQLLGVQCYSGMVQHIERYARRLREYEIELTLLESILDKMKSQGLPTAIVSGGGTGTFDIDRRRGLFSECQAGSYVFMDVQYNDVELFKRGRPPFKTSLFVQSMVLSNNHSGSATIDAGFKSFSMDGPVPQVRSGAPKGARFEFYGDEFGMLRWLGTPSRLRLGRKVELITPHCDPTVNLHGVYHCVRGTRLVDIWPVDARGTV
jgi:3-hydroxy-D-aspartate aldolase